MTDWNPGNGGDIPNPLAPTDRAQSFASQDTTRYTTRTQNPNYQDPNWTWAPTPAPAPAKTARKKAAGKGASKSRRGSAGPRTSATGAPTAAETQASIDQRIKDQYPSFAWALEIPDLAAVLRKAINDPSYSSVRLQADLQNTNWWKTTPGTVRSWIQEKSQDPATYGQQRGDQLNSYKQLARQYLVPMSDATIGNWVDQQDPDAFKNYLTTQASSLFPSMKAALDRGVTPDQYVDPYRQTAAKTLEISPDQVDFMDPKWQKAISQIDPKTGDRTAMSLADWQTELRSNGTYGYQYTQQARDQAYDLVGTLEKSLGFSKGL